jgi:hypothetical protein
MDQSTSLRVQLNSAEYAAEQAQAAYIASLPVPEQAAFYLGQAAPAMNAAKREAQQLENTCGFVLELMKRETGGSGSLQELQQATEQQFQDLTEEIERLKSQIRMERRQFLDAQPSVSPAVGGLYFTQVPDNQLLIALMATLGALLVFVSAGIYLGLFPVEYLLATAVSERLTLIAVLWAVAVLGTYLGLYTFT